MNAAVRLAYVFAHYQAMQPPKSECHCRMSVHQILLNPNCFRSWFTDLSDHTQGISEHAQLFHSKDLN